MARNAQDEDHPENNSKVCDHCNEKQALLYCRADSAKLCISCDRQVHAANAIFSKHSRAHLCDVCRDQPASILCASHQLLLCPNCDFDAHPPSLEAHQQNRRSLEPFSGCPSATELSSLFGFDDDKSLWFSDGNLGGSDEGLWSEFVWEAPSVLSLQDLIMPTEARNGSGWDFQALSVPPPPKHRNVACGKNKEEVIRQLRDLFKSESVLNNDYSELESGLVLQFLLPEGSDQNDFPQKIDSITVEPDSASLVAPGCKENSPTWNGSSCEVTNQVASTGEHLLENSTSSKVVDGQNATVTEIRTEEIHRNVDEGVPQHPVIREITSLPPKAVYELLAQDRDSVISRYKEKKKSRRYDKQIRYESRKTRADSRARVRGRFAKATQDQSEGTSLNRT